MSATSAPFGFRPAYHMSGLEHAKRYPIAAAYGTAMYKHQPVILNTNGTITVGTAAADIIGHAAGFEWIDATGKPTVSTFWPAGQTVLAGTTPYAWVYDDPDIILEVQASGPVAATAIGDQADVINVGNNANGTSTCGLNATLVGAGIQGQYRIVEIAPNIDNDVGDAFTVVRVRVARHQFITSKVAI